MADEGEDMESLEDIPLEEDESEQDSYSLGSFEIDETLYRDLEVLAYKPALRFSKETGIGRKWRRLEADEINDFAEGAYHKIIAWGENNDLVFEQDPEESRSIMRSNTAKHHDSGEYITGFELYTVEANENGRPIVSVSERYNGPVANPDGIFADYEDPDFLKLKVRFNTTSPEYRDAHENLEDQLETLLDKPHLAEYTGQRADRPF